MHDNLRLQRLVQSLASLVKDFVQPNDEAPADPSALPGLSQECQCSKRCPFRLHWTKSLLLVTSAEISQPLCLLQLANSVSPKVMQQSTWPIVYRDCSHPSHQQCMPIIVCIHKEVQLHTSCAVLLQESYWKQHAFPYCLQTKFRALPR